MDFTSLSQRITDDFTRLSPQLRQAARHVLDRPDDVALMSMRRLAANAGVHPSTMVRLARAFDCSSYTCFREPFQQRLRARPESYLARARDLQSRGGGAKEALLGEVLSSATENLRETFEANGPEKFIECAAVLGKARKVFTVGLRGVFPVAYAFHYSYRMYRDNGVLLDGASGAFADDLREMSSDDVIFAIGFDPYTMETVRALEYARQHGAGAVALTDSPVSPLAKNADHVLIAGNESPSFFHSVSAALAAAEAINVMLVAEGGKRALGAIEDSEEQLASFNAYWRHNPKRRRTDGK